RCCPDAASRPTTSPPEAVTTMPASDTGTGVAPLGARQASFSVDGTSAGCAGVPSGGGAVSLTVALLSLPAHTARPATSAATAMTAAVTRSRLRFHGERRPRTFVGAEPPSAGPVAAPSGADDSVELTSSVCRGRRFARVCVGRALLSLARAGAAAPPATAPPAAPGGTFPCLGLALGGRGLLRGGVALGRRLGTAAAAARATPRT